MESSDDKPKRKRGRPRRNQVQVEHESIDVDNGGDTGMRAGGGVENGVGSGRVDRLGSLVADAISKKIGKIKKEIEQEIKERERQEEQARLNHERKLKLYGQAMLLAVEAGDFDQDLLAEILSKYIKGARDRKFVGLQAGSGAGNQGDDTVSDAAPSGHQPHQDNKDSAGNGDGLEEL